MKKTATTMAALLLTFAISTPAYADTTSQVTTKEKQVIHSLIVDRGYPCYRILSAHGPVGGTRYHVACSDGNGRGSVYLVEDLGNNYWTVSRSY